MGPVVGVAGVLADGTAAGRDLVAEAPADGVSTTLESKPAKRWDSPFDFEVETRPKLGRNVQLPPGN
jgi:hypothetical protein